MGDGAESGPSALLGPTLTSTLAKGWLPGLRPPWRKTLVTLKDRPRSTDSQGCALAPEEYTVLESPSQAKLGSVSENTFIFPTHATRNYMYSPKTHLHPSSLLTVGVIGRWPFPVDNRALSRNGSWLSFNCSWLSHSCLWEPLNQLVSPGGGHHERLTRNMFHPQITNYKSLLLQCSNINFASESSGFCECLVIQQQGFKQVTFMIGAKRSTLTNWI